MRWSVRGHGYWFVPFLFSLASVGGVGFYQRVDPCPNGAMSCSFHLSRFTEAVQAVGLSPSPIALGGNDRVAIYWLVAIPVTLALAVGFYFIHRGPRPVGRLIPVAAAGLVLLAALFGAGFTQGLILPGNFTSRGLVALVVLSLVMLSMAVVERNGTLALLSVGAVAMTFVANLYDIENVTGVWLNNDAAPNLVVPAFYFLAAAVLLAVPDVLTMVRSGRRRPAQTGAAK